MSDANATTNVTSVGAAAGAVGAPSSVSTGTAATGSAAAAAATATLPKDAVALRSLLHSMGLSPADYQPKLLAQLIEFQQRYAREILEDAQEYALHRDKHATKHFIDVDDVELAVQTRLAENFTGPPPKEFMYPLAQARNAVPLPIVPTREGVHLPPERFCLMQPNYRVKPPATSNRRGEM